MGANRAGFGTNPIQKWLWASTNCASSIKSTLNICFGFSFYKLQKISTVANTKSEPIFMCARLGAGPFQLSVHSFWSDARFPHRTDLSSRIELLSIIPKADWSAELHENGPNHGTGHPNQMPSGVAYVCPWEQVSGTDLSLVQALSSTGPDCIGAWMWPDSDVGPIRARPGPDSMSNRSS